MTKELEYEIVSYDKDGESLGKVWWNGKKVTSDNAKLLKLLEDASIDGISIKDGKEFLQKLPSYFRGAYLSAHRVRNNDVE